uniref:Uncharacterized protein n=1 Tax=Brassica oleracea var. oleracea TaxID=109376 RepID=A0A0D3E6G4_BRAOL
MTIEQVLQELNKSKRWAGLHVADSSCFHYRRRLMLRVLEPLKVKGSNANDKFDAHKTLMLSETGESIFTNEETGIFIGNEIHLLESSMTVLDNKFEDFRAQALHASVYMLWLTKHIPEVWSMLEEKLGTEKLKCVLSTVDQERPLLAFAPN